MNLKQYNPVKVKDPSSDGYSIRLHPRQSFQLMLTQIFEDEVFDVKLVSDYLVLEEFTIDKDKSREIYCFSQKYDLERWSKISTLFLGNIILTIKPKPEGKKETETIRLCVFLNCSDASKANVVTVINPDNHTLKIESNQIVEVVLSDTHYARWNLVGIEALGMSCARSETVFNDVTDVYDPASLFCPEPRCVGMPVNPALDAAHNTVSMEELNSDRKLGMKEYHFFTHLNLAALKKAHSSPNGTYPMGEMKFVCKTDDGLVMEERALTLMMNLKGSGKRISTSEFQAIRHNTRNWNTPFNSSMRQSVLSPGFNESVDLQSNADTLYIEIPQPSVYFNSDRLAEEAFWGHDLNLDAKFDLRVRELTPRHVNGFMVQRFMVGGIQSHKPPGDLLFIGALRFVCRSYKENGYTTYKGISLSLWKMKGFVEDRRKTAEFSYVGGGGTGTGTRTVYRKPPYSIGFNQHQHQHQQLSYDVELEQLHSDLQGIKVVALDEIVPKQSDFFGYDVDDLMLGVHQHSKKKTESSNGAGAGRLFCGPQRPQAGLLGRQAISKIGTTEDVTSNWYNWFDLV